MSNMRLFWECDGQVTPFTIYRSESVFDKTSLPQPYKTNISQKELLETVSVSDHFYYMIRNGNHYSELFDYKTIDYMFPINLPIVNATPTDNVNGWTVLTGSLVTRANYFYGVGASLVFYQDIPIPPYLYELIDSGNIYTSFDWKFGGWDSDADNGYTSLYFLNNTNSSLKELRSATETIYTNSLLVDRNMECYIPPLTRTIRIQCTGTRVQGTNLDAYWAGFKLSLNKDKYSLYNNYDNFLTSILPVAWYKLDEDPTSPLAIDSSQNSFHASFREGQSAYQTFRQTPLRKGSIGSMGFNVGQSSYGGGVPQCITPINPTLYNLTKNSFTLCFWAKRDGDSQYWHTITQCGSPSSGRNTNFRIIGNMQLQIEENQRGLGIDAMQQNELAFICFVYDVQRNLYFAYKNEKRYVGTYQSNSSGGRAVATHFPANYDWNYYGFKGYMSDVCMFNKALTSLEVEKLYKLGKL